MGWQTTAPVMAAAWSAPATPVMVRAPSFEITSALDLSPAAGLTPPDGFASRTLAAAALAAAGAVGIGLQVTEQA